MSAIEINSAGHFIVIGELSFGTVPGLDVRGRELIAASPQPVFDFTNVTFSDNAGVALLVSWARAAHHINKKIIFTDVSKQLLDIINICGLGDILPLSNAR